MNDRRTSTKEGISDTLRRLAETYANGEFADLGTGCQTEESFVARAKMVGDTLFAFLAIELSRAEGCHNSNEAVSRLDSAIADIEAVRDSIRSA